VVIDCSTIARRRGARDRRAAWRKASLSFLDAPVSGGQKGAPKGRLTFFVGGRRRRPSERGEPRAGRHGQAHHAPRGLGLGQLDKAVNQIVVANTLVAVAEGIAFAQKAGPPMPALHEALMGGAPARGCSTCWARR